ncbi:MAG: hypothetical protein U9O59_04290 [Actinomycetota bacterium]|nr:hypothetical protein [Actinomycetota bacterium]
MVFRSAKLASLKMPIIHFYKIPEQQIRIFLSIIKDTYLTGKIKNSMGAMFISLAKAYAGKNNINLNFR